jgi:hypothetical protein
MRRVGFMPTIASITIEMAMIEALDPRMTQTDISKWWA